MKKKLLSLLLALCLVMALVPMTAFAEGTSVDNWDGTADTSWYTDHKTDTEYHFTTAEQLAGLAQLVNDKTASVSFKGKTIYLDNDLDLSGCQWTPIGNGSNFGRYFAGTFDGQYHKITNLHHHSTGDELIRNGLFGVVSDGGTLKNLLVIDADIASNDGSLLAGILADWVDGGTVENCYTSGKIENNVGDKMVGGLIGQCTGSTQVKGCGSDATVISTESDEDHVDTVGGLIGQWENSADSSSITDCWFGGSVSCNNIYSAVGGILGANFENFSGNKPGVIIKNCIVATKNITGAEPGNITWITAVVKTHVTDCIWPDTPPDGVTLDEETYPDNKGNYLAVAKLVVDWDAGTAGADPTFDQSSCGTAVSNFTSADVLAGLQTNAGAGVEWVAGIGHPTFVWDANNIPADYTKVDAAIAKANALNKDNYKDFSAVETAVNAVVRDKNITEQSEVDAMAKAIEDAIAALQYKDADYTKVDEAIAKANALNKDNYKDFSAVETAVKAVVRDKNITEQSEVDAMAKAIEDAIAALQYKDADYTKVDEAIAKANALNKDNYKDFSAVETAVKAVVRDKNITEQSEVDAMAKAIEDAIAALQYKDADYTKVDAAIAKANALKKDDYKDFSGVEAAVNAVVRDKNITEQTEVDAMAKAIEDAIAALQYKDADYTKVDEAIAKANALNKDNYKDFSAVETAVKAVVRDKNITEQSEVDAMAKAIEDAIAALQYKDADYTKVDAAIAKANALNKDNYKDFSAVETAVKAVVRDKNITEQSEVDAMAKAIEDAIAALQYKDADYTKVDAAIAKANALNKDNYKDFSAVETAVKAVVRDKNITEQSEVDAMAKAIEDAIAALQYKDADYTKVDAAIAKANALKKDDYKDFSGVEAAVNAVVRDKNITEQTEVDAMAKAIEDAIAALEKKPASTKPGTSDKSPQTGDNSNFALWIALLFISGGAAIGTTVVSRKKKYNR